MWADIDINKRIGNPEHIKVFTTDAAETWFEENDPEGVAFEYEVLTAFSLPTGTACNTLSRSSMVAPSKGPS